MTLYMSLEFEFQHQIAGIGYRRNDPKWSTGIPVQETGRQTISKFEFLAIFSRNSKIKKQDESNNMS